MICVWTDINRVTIDKSMINYMGRAATYVQYMPAKLINHDIKVFSICCDISAIVLGLKVYVGQEDDYDNTALGMCDELVKESGITSFQRRTLYTDNYYTPKALHKHIFNEYGWKIVGTIVPMNNNSRVDNDITFLKFSNGASN